MSLIEIHTDSRESKCGIIALLKQREQVNVIDYQLPVGDYYVGGGVIIERKTAIDLIQSMEDGRFHEQALNMVANYAKPAYILEGDIYSTRSKWSVTALGGCMAWLHAKGISVMPSSSAQATAEIIFHMAKNAQVEMKDVPMRTKKPAPSELNALFILEGLPGVSSVQARRFLAHFGSVQAVMAATPEQLAQVSRVGKPTAQRIHDVLTWRAPAVDAVN